MTKNSEIAYFYPKLPNLLPNMSIDNQNNNDRRIRRTRKSIKEALIGLLQKQKINQISITELCNQADINRKTFYNHYSGVRNVLDEIEDEYITKYLFYLNKENILYSLSDPYPFVSRLTNEIATNVNVFSVISKTEEYIYLKERIKIHLSNNLNDIIRQKPHIDNETLSIYIDFITAGMSSVYQQWLISNKQISKDKLSKLICEIVSNGSRTLIQSSV